MKIKKIKISILITLCLIFGSFNFYVYAQSSNTDTTLSLDSDDDGLTDAEENAYGTNPNLADTDGDSYSDGVEIKSGYDPLKPAPGDKLAALAPSAIENTDENINLTEDLSQAVDKILAENEGEISVSTIESLVSSSLSEIDSSANITFDDLPAVDESKIKILKQPYSGLSSVEQKNKRTEDLSKYIISLAYILAMNSPILATSPEDLNALFLDFQEKFTAFSQMNGDPAYFLDLLNRLESVLAQMEAIEVPESVVEIHVKLLRLGKAYLQFREVPVPTSNDPLGTIAIITKFQKLNELGIEFFNTEISDYLKTTNILEIIK